MKVSSKREYIPPQEFTSDCEPSSLKVQKDYTYSTKPTPTTKNAKKVKELKKRVKVLKEIIQKKNKKISTLKDIVQSLKENKLVTETERDLFEQNFEGVSKEIVHNQIYNSRVASKHLQCYNETMKQFAVTLHYYSPKPFIITPQRHSTLFGVYCYFHIQVQYELGQYQ